MPFDRMDRISEEVRRELDKIVREELHDPRIGGTYSIVRADVTRDMRYCKVRVSILEQERRADMMKALKNAAGFIRRALGKRVDLRYTPELLFELDTNIEYAAHIDQILRDAAPVREADASAKDAEDDDDDLFEDAEDEDDGDDGSV